MGLPVPPFAARNGRCGARLRRRSGWSFVAAWSTLMKSRSKLDRLFDYQRATRASVFPFSLLPLMRANVKRCVSRHFNPSRRG
jgi:hypothetical protein